MRLVIAATPKLAEPTIKSLINAKSDHLVTIVTQPDRPAGRGKQLKKSEIAEIFPEALKPETEAALSDVLQGSDLLITIGYGRILKSETLSIPKFGGINLHFSLLPKWRGAAPVQRAIEAGDRTTGVTVFQMDSGMDTGPIWRQIEYQIPYGASTTEVFAALSELGVTAVEEALLMIKEKREPTPQSGDASYASKISKSECAIDWYQPSETIIRKIKAFAFNPGVYARIREEQLKITDARISKLQLAPGELNSNGEVGTIDGSIKLLKVTPSGKRNMSVEDWLNGFKLKPGERFE